MLTRRLLLAAGGGASFGGGTTIPDPTLPALDLYQRTVLTTPTYDGSGQAVHPSVVKVPGGWHGWLYWMAMTPYPGGDAAYENPSILVSNDGYTWQVPGGLTNPVVANPGGGAYNSDPDLVYDADTDTLWMFYRTSNVGVYVRSSTDGVSWSAATVVVASAATTGSPAVVKGGDGTWRMWNVDVSTDPNTITLRTASTPDGTWSAPTTLGATEPQGRDFWHLDVVLDGSTYRAVMIAVDLGTTGTAGKMTLGSSADGVSWTFSLPVLSPTGSGWDGSIVYRGSPIYEQSRWRCWYSGMSTGYDWHIGYTELDPADFP